MPRKKRKHVRHWKIDPKHGNILVGRFIGIMMIDGKKGKAEKIVYDSLDIIHERTKKGGLNVFEQA